MIKLVSFRHALNGFVLFVRTESHAQVHIIAAISVSILGILLKLASWEWISILLCIGAVVSMEIINTSIEKLTDMVSPQISSGAKMVKDLAAAAVLFTSFIASIIGLIIFAPRLLTLF